MKILLVLLTVLLFATSTMAQIDSGINSFGIYFDEGATRVVMDGAANFALDIYLILVNPTVEVVKGFGLDIIAVRFETPGCWTPFTPSSLLADGSMLQQDTNYGVGFSDPGIAVTGPVVPLMRTTGAYFDAPGCMAWYVLPGTAGPSSQVGIVALLDGDGNVITAQGANNGEVCACMGADCWPLATEDVSFGTLKALYR